MADPEIEKRNLKLQVFNKFPYERFKQVCDAICALGFDCDIVDNGNVIFTDKQGENNG